jgi:hypothetical protein
MPFIAVEVSLSIVRGVTPFITVQFIAVKRGAIAIARSLSIV